MKLLLLCHAFNGLTQRLHGTLREAGHAVTVEFDIADAVTEEAVALAEPDLVIAPFLKRRIPESVWSVRPCLVVHPGPPGDRGPAALDWAVLRGDREGGVTVLQATCDFDAGPVWAFRAFPIRSDTSKARCRRTREWNSTRGHIAKPQRFSSTTLPEIRYTPKLPTSESRTSMNTRAWSSSHTGKRKT